AGGAALAPRAAEPERPRIAADAAAASSTVLPPAAGRAGAGPCQGAGRFKTVAGAAGGGGDAGEPRGRRGAEPVARRQLVLIRTLRRSFLPGAMLRDFLLAPLLPCRGRRWRSGLPSGRGRISFAGRTGRLD